MTKKSYFFYRSKEAYKGLGSRLSPNEESWMQIICKREEETNFFFYSLVNLVGCMVYNATAFHQKGSSNSGCFLYARACQTAALRYIPFVLAVLGVGRDL